MSKDKVIIIGAGAAGMMAAYSSKLYHPLAEVYLFERNDEVGKKLKLTGGGRCNVTVDCSNQEVINHTWCNGKFLYSSLHEFGPTSIMDFFNERGCLLKTEDKQRVFPVSNQADDVINILKSELKKQGVVVLYNQLVTNLNIEEKYIEVSGKKHYFSSLIVAVGGKSFPTTGSDGSFYELLKEKGLPLTPLFPAEVPLVSQDLLIQEKILQGISLKDIKLKLKYKNKRLEFVDDIIFTHYGLSGPAALKSSYFINKFLQEQAKAAIKIDFLPNMDKEMILNLISEKQPILPKRLYKYLNEISNGESELIENIKNFPININGTLGFKAAFVTSGGVDVKHLDPKTLKSKLHSNISFAGEIIDVNGATGGYNLTIAFATGYLAGKHCL